MERKATVTQTDPSENVLEAIQNRRSVRDFTPQRLDVATVEALLAAAVRAPTALHAEPWRFVVIQDLALLARISTRAKALFLDEVQRQHLSHGWFVQRCEDPAFNLFYNAGTLIVICAPQASAYAPADCWLAAQNLMLAAHALGLGTCVIGSAVEGLNTPDIRAEIGLPEDTQAVAPIIVGVPADDGPPVPRHPPRILNWLGRQ